MRISQYVAVSAIASIASAQTAPGFGVQVEENLPVAFTASNTEVSPPGVLIDRPNVLEAPEVSAPAGAASGENYVLFMVDQDVPRNGTKVNLLHWFQANLQPSPEVLQPAANPATPIAGAEYRPPTPPGGSGPHAYSLVLFAQPEGFAVPEAYSNINPPTDNSARVGFDLPAFVAASGLGEPLAGNYFLVLNGTAEESAAVTMTMPSATSSPSVPTSQYTGGAIAVNAKDQRLGVGLGLGLVGAAFCLF